MLVIPHPYPEEGAVNWIATAQPGRDFAIVLRRARTVIGGININPIFEHQRASLGYWCAIDFWGQGYATEAVWSVVDYGFRALGLKRIYAECHGDNVASRRVLEKVGMTLEGRLRQHSFRVDRFADKLQFGVLQSEWLSQNIKSR